MIVKHQSEIRNAFSEKIKYAFLFENKVTLPLCDNLLTAAADLGSSDENPLETRFPFRVWRPHRYGDHAWHHSSSTRRADQFFSGARLAVGRRGNHSCQSVPTACTSGSPGMPWQVAVSPHLFNYCWPFWAVDGDEMACGHCLTFRYFRGSCLF